MSKVGNNSGKDYLLACCLCKSTRKELHMLGHRNKGGHLIGFLYVCGEDSGKLEGKDLKVEFLNTKESADVEGTKRNDNTGGSDDAGIPD